MTNPYIPMTYGGPSTQPTGPYQYGYATQPGVSGYGYYEQQTPAGSFAAANQQYGTAQSATNPYIGQTSAYAPMPGQVGAAQAATSNPYLGMTTQQVGYQAAQGAGANPYGMGNPYLQTAIDSAQADANRAFQNSTMPAFDRQMQASGSFGNTGVQQMQQQAMSDHGRNLGNIASGMRMQDYTQQQQLAENALNRQQQMSQFNASNALQAGQFNAGLNAGDIARNLGALSQLGMFNAGQLNNMGQFNASLGNNANQFNASLGASDLSRNAQLAQAMSQFNAGAGNSMSQFNAGQGNAMNQFNASAGNQAIQNYLSRLQNQGQFDANLDFNAWQANNQNMRQGSIDQLNALSQLLGMNQQYGVGNATTIQNTPLNYLQMFAGLGQGLGGMGGTNSQDMQGNPWLGALGGWMAMQKMFGG